MQKLHWFSKRMFLFFTFCQAFHASLLWSQLTPPNQEEEMILVSAGLFRFYDKGVSGSMEFYSLYSGDIGQSYYVSSHLVTKGEYSDFLNAVAVKQDPHDLYSNMESLLEKREVAPHQFCYIPLPDSDGNDQGAIPMSSLARSQALRYCNWKENGSLNAKDAKKFLLTRGVEVTEIGAYKIEMRNNVEVITAAVDAIYHLPTQSEFIAAAFQGAITCSSNSEWTDLDPTASQSDVFLLSYVANRDYQAKPKDCYDEFFKDRTLLPVIACDWASPNDTSGKDGKLISFRLAKRIIPPVDAVTDSLNPSMK